MSHPRRPRGCNSGGRDFSGRAIIIFSDESLLQEQTSPWALTKLVPEVFEFRPANRPVPGRSQLVMGRNDRLLISSVGSLVSLEVVLFEDKA